MVKTITKIIIKCDVCGRKKKNESVDNLFRYSGWVKYDFSKFCIPHNKVQTVDAELLVCDKCAKKKELRYLYLKFIEPFIDLSKIK